MLLLSQLAFFSLNVTMDGPSRVGCGIKVPNKIGRDIHSNRCANHSTNTETVRKQGSGIPSKDVSAMGSRGSKTGRVLDVDTQGNIFKPYKNLNNYLCKQIHETRYHYVKLNQTQKGKNHIFSHMQNLNIFVL